MKTPRFSAASVRTYGRSGRRLDAENELQRLLVGTQTKYVSPYILASAYAGLGNKDEAFQWLETAYREHEDWMTYLNVDPELDSLRTDPRFRDLMDRVGLPS